MTPQLRFPGFTDEWQVKKLGDITKINPKVKNLPEKFIYIDLESVSKGRLLEEKSAERATAPSRAQRLLSKEDILFQTVRPYQRNNFFFDIDGEYVASTGYAQIRYDQSPRFLYQLAHTDDFVNKVLDYCTGTNYPAISSNDLGKVIVKIPLSVDEQKKIAKFLTAIDERIELLVKKIELQKKYKKGVMRKIFNQELRFKNQAGIEYPEWVEKRLNEIAYKENSTVSANEIEGKKGDFKVYGASGLLQTLDRYDQTEEYIAVVKDGAGVGRVGLYEPRSSVLGTLNVIKPMNGINTRYLFTLVNSINFGKYTIGSTIPHVYFKDYAKELFGIPCEREQEKIANFLTAIDDRIKLEQAKLAQAKKFKKSLLQRIFV